MPKISQHLGIFQWENSHIYNRTLKQTSLELLSLAPRDTLWSVNKYSARMYTHEITLFFENLPTFSVMLQTTISVKYGAT